MSKTKKNKSDSLVEMVTEIKNLDNEKLEKLFDNIQIMFSKNLILLRGTREGLVVGIKRDFDLIPGLEENRKEVSHLISNIILLATSYFEGFEELTKIENYKEYEKIIDKLKANKIYDRIISKVKRKNNTFNDISYSFITREYIGNKDKLNIKLIQLEINYNEVMNEEKEIIIEVDVDQLSSLINALQEAQGKLQKGDDKNGS